jgi:hypothetical protein
MTEQAWDTVVQGEDGGWFQPTANPFGHGCCDCGLAHKVEYTLVDETGETVQLGAGLSLVLRFSRDMEATANLRNEKIDGRALVQSSPESVIAALKACVNDLRAIIQHLFLEGTMTKWYSSNEEDYKHTDIEDAIAEVFDDTEIKVGAVRLVWEGDAVTRKAGDYLPKRHLGVVEQLTDNAYEECGEYAENWLSKITVDQEQDLRDRIANAINAWADDHGLHPTFGTVENVRDIMVRLTSEDGDWEYV